MNSLVYVVRADVRSSYHDGTCNLLLGVYRTLDGANRALPEWTRAVREDDPRAHVYVEAREFCD